MRNYIERCIISVLSRDSNFEDSTVMMLFRFAVVAGLALGSLLSVSATSRCSGTREITTDSDYFPAPDDPKAASTRPEAPHYPLWKRLGLLGVGVASGFALSESAASASSRGLPLQFSSSSVGGGGGPKPPEPLALLGSSAARREAESGAAPQLSQTPPLDRQPNEEEEHPFAEESRMDPVNLRFNNSCFWRKQREAEQRLLQQYVDKRIAAGIRPESLRLRSSGAVAQGRPSGFLATQPSSALAAPKDVSRSTVDLNVALRWACERWVPESTDHTWHATDPKDRLAAVQQFFADDFTSTTYSLLVGGVKSFTGRKKLHEIIEAKLKQFPDLKIRVLNT